jgi:tetratricopeptide (TPR) repeat protein
LSSFLLFSLLALVTGNPLLAALIVLAAWWLGDRATFRVLPDPFHVVTRWRRTAELRAQLAVNPHDRRARFALSELLLEAGRPAAAAAALRPNLEAGDEDVRTAHLWGAALWRSGDLAGGERALLLARAAEPGFRAGELDLELGRARLARGDFAGAVAALEALLVVRPGTVEGRFFLVKALTGLGRADDAARRRAEAWREYLALPRFQRSRQRWYAWRLQPARPALLGLGLLLAAVVLLRACAP